MSYLMLPDGIPNFTKAVISFWFRVPQESIDKCLAKTLASPPSFDPKPLFAIIPLVVFGGGQTNSEGTYFVKDLGGYTSGNIPHVLYTQDFEIVNGGYIDPSVIGLAIGVDFNTGAFTGLGVYGRFLTSANPSIEGIPIAVSGTPTFISDGGVNYTNGMNVTWAYKPQPQGPQAYEFFIDVGTSDFADKWHHILVSCDLGNSISATSASETLVGGITGVNHIWAALDDKNYTQYDLLPNWLEGDDDNACYPDAVLSVASHRAPPENLPLPFAVPTDPGLDNIINGVPGNVPKTDTPWTTTVPGSPVPANGTPFGFPATDKFVANIYRVELAEFQLFTGVALDTGVEENRRLFLTKKDKNNEQFPTNSSPLSVPIRKYAVGDPTTWEPGADSFAFAPGLVDPSGVPTTVALTGGKPVVADVDFTKCSFNWMMGRNLGTAKGKSATTGKIKAYFPDPKLKG